jgi:hypothetical protein
MLTVGVSAILFWVKAFENVWWVLLAIGNAWAFISLASTYEWSVRDIACFLKRMANDALHE